MWIKTISIFYIKTTHLVHNVLVVHGCISITCQPKSAKSVRFSKPCQEQTKENTFGKASKAARFASSQRGTFPKFPTGLPVHPSALQRKPYWNWHINSQDRSTNKVSHYAHKSWYRIHIARIKASSMIVVEGGEWNLRLQGESCWIQKKKIQQRIFMTARNLW